MFWTQSLLITKVKQTLYFAQKKIEWRKILELTYTCKNVYLSNNNMNYIQIISKSTRQMSPQYVWNVNKQSKHYAVEIRILIHNQFVGKSNLLVISLQPEGFTITVKSSLFVSIYIYWKCIFGRISDLIFWMVWKQRKFYCCFWLEAKGLQGVPAKVVFA